MMDVKAKVNNSIISDFLWRIIILICSFAVRQCSPIGLLYSYLLIITTFIQARSAHSNVLGTNFTCDLFSPKISLCNTTIFRTNGIDHYFVDVIITPDVRLNQIYVSPNSLNFLFIIKLLISVKQVKLSLMKKEPTRASFYRPVFGVSNFTIDLCGYFTGRSTSAFLEIMATQFRQRSNFFHPCPFSVN